MKFTLFIIVLFFHFCSFGQDSFEKILKNGKGEVVINYRNSDSFISLDKNGEISGAEYEILLDFFSWVEEEYNVQITPSFVMMNSFSELYESISSSDVSGLFGSCSFSITDKRLKEVRFSPAYLPDIEVMISSKDLPILQDTSEFRIKFKTSKAITVQGSTFEDDIRNLNHSGNVMDMEFVSTTEQVISSINSTNNTYGFIELPNFFKLYKNGLKLNRQNLFLVQREGYGIIYPKESDWNDVVWAYFKVDDNRVRVNGILEKYFGIELINFINEIQFSSDSQKKLLLLNRENELETLEANNLKLSLENEKLDNEKNKAEREILIAQESALEMYILLGVISFVLILGLVVYAYYLKNKDHKIISEQKKQVEIQKEIVEEKHRLITDSIHYAFTIQKAMLQGEDHINPQLPEHFVFFKPKDVVSGDFYWSKVVGDFCFFASVDCTGHGVPGGFMSVLGISLLNDILFDHDILNPAQVLEALNKRVITELDQSSREGSSKDGMDISLARINLKTLEMIWAGAHNPLYIFRNGELTELKANKQPIGYYDYSKPFDNVSFQLQKKDMIYSYTDGYPDQFGGERDKKLKSSGFKDLLKDIQLLSIPEQKKYLDNHFKSWKGENEQVDDVCVIGMRI